MSNEFLEMAASAFAESVGVTGATQFRIRNLPREGSFTDLTEEEKMEWGQIVANASATLEFAVERFTPPLVNGERVQVTRAGGTKAMRIGKVIADEVSIRLVLTDPDE